MSKKVIFAAIAAVAAMGGANADVSYCDRGSASEHSHFSSEGIERAEGVGVKARGPDGWETVTNDHPLVRWVKRSKDHAISRLVKRAKNAELSIAIDIVPADRERADLYVKWIQDGKVEGESAQMDTGSEWRETTNGVARIGNVKAVTADFVREGQSRWRRLHAIPTEHDRMVLVDFSVRVPGDTNDVGRMVAEDPSLRMPKRFLDEFRVDNPRGQPGTRTTGTAWFVSPVHLVTCGHCAEAWMDFWYEDEDGNRTCFKLVDRDGENDLALLELADEDGERHDFLPVARQTPRMAEKVWTLGYPLPQLLGRQLVYGEGVVTGKAGFKGDESQFMVSAPIRPGLSGGPVFSERGGVCGVMAASMTAEQPALQGHPSPESNWAVRTEPLRALLERNAVPFAEEPGEPGAQDRAQAVETAAKAVVLLFAGAGGEDD